MKEDDALNFLQNDCVFDGKDDTYLRELARKARLAAQELPRPKLQVSERDLAEFKDQLEPIAKNPRIPEAVELNEWAFKNVEIDGLVCFQKFVSVGYASSTVQNFNLSRFEEQINFCLTNKYLGKTRISQLGRDTYCFSGPDLRILTSRNSHDSNLNADEVTFRVGATAPFVQVVKCEDRYILKNGYHRVFALREAGFRSTPCILIQGKNRAEVGIPQGYFSEDLLFSANPPTFSSFFSDAISPRVKFRSYGKVVYLRPEVLNVPASKITEYLQPIDEADALQLTKQHQLADSEFLDVEPCMEAWNIYRLNNGTVLKIRRIPIRARKVAEGNYGFQESNVMMTTLSSPNSPRGEPSRGYLSQDAIRRAVVEDVKFKVVSEPVNEYILGDSQKIVYRTKLFKVFRTSLFDPHGDPIYTIQTQPSSIELITPIKK